MNWRQSVLTAWCAAGLLCACTSVVSAAELAIPPGYFDASGGFYPRSSTEPTCWYYSPAAGCTIDVSYSTALEQVVPPNDSPLAIRSWYAGEVLYGQAPVPCPACVPRPVEFFPGERETIGPGLVIPDGDAEQGHAP